MLPWIELALGALLVVQLGGRWTALVAAGLLLAFTVAIVGQLARGREVPCACFGAWSASKPVGGWSVARNLALIALSLVGVLGR